MYAPGLESAPVVMMLGFGFLAALPFIGQAVGSIFGRASEGRANQQANQAAANARQNELLSRLFDTQQQAQMQQGSLDLARQQFGANRERDHLRRALIGQLLGNAQNLDINVKGIPKANISGGLNFDTLGAGGRATALDMARRAQTGLDTPMTFEGGNLLRAPDLLDVPRQ